MNEQKLSYYEKLSILSIIMYVAVFGGIFYDSYRYYQLDTPTQSLLNFWGHQFLEVFLYLVSIYFVIYVLFNVLNKKVTGESRPKIKDERDNTIELKAIHAGYYTMILGVFGVMLSAMHVKTMSPIFIVIMASFMGAAIIADVVRIYLYRKSS